MAKVQRVLLIGGPMDGKWSEKQGSNTTMRFPKPVPMKIQMVEEVDLSIPLPEYDVYYLDRIALWGEGVWLGYHAETMDKLERDAPWDGREPRIRMALKAILQRDVATEMGL